MWHLLPWGLWTPAFFFVFFWFVCFLFFFLYAQVWIPSLLSKNEPKSWLFKVTAVTSTCHLLLRLFSERWRKSREVQGVEEV